MPQYPIPIKQFPDPDFDFDFDLASIPTYLRLRLRLAYYNPAAPPLISEKYSNVMYLSEDPCLTGQEGWEMDFGPHLEEDGGVCK
jgi:hypothetical protein